MTGKKDDDLDKRVQDFDRKVIVDYLTPIIVSALTTILILMLYSSDK
ncbi:hypothetical protein [Lacticaseibacillus absianus]|nr:hypothetical protein [Lacticaseibacillus absianus]